MSHLNVGIINFLKLGKNILNFKRGAKFTKRFIRRGGGGVRPYRNKGRGRGSQREMGNLHKLKGIWQVPTPACIYGAQERNKNISGQIMQNIFSHQV